MSNDLVKRLRHVTEFWRPEAEDTRLMREAADEIERLTQERDALRELIEANQRWGKTAAEALKRAEAAERKLQKEPSFSAVREALEILITDLDERGIRHDDFRQQRARAALEVVSGKEG